MTWTAGRRYPPVTPANERLRPLVCAAFDERVPVRLDLGPDLGRRDPALDSNSGVLARIEQWLDRWDLLSDPSYQS